MSESLFPMPEQPVPTEAPKALGTPRLERANREQMRFQPLCLDELIPYGHRARSVWSFVERLDLSKFYAGIEAIEGHGGRPAIDPKILVALWLYATIEGVGSARELARLTEEHHAFLWLCGGVTINHHTLSDFRTDAGAVLDELLTQSAGVLIHAGVADLKRVAQDGVRIRASAGAASFHRRGTLEKCLSAARQQVAELKKDLEGAANPRTERAQAARERVARERQERIERALEEMEKVEASKKPEEREKARVSSTDPEARVMKMADGGFRPGYNIQYATTTEGQVVVGVAVDNVGSDMGKLVPMVEQLENRFGQTPEEMLVDGNFAKQEDLIKLASSEGTTVVYAPLQQPKKEGVDPHQAKPKDAPAVAEWRSRMGTPEAKEIYKERAATAECVNAQARNRGLIQVLVRGTKKVLSIALWFGLAQNTMRAIALGVATASGP